MGQTLPFAESTYTVLVLTSVSKGRDATAQVISPELRQRALMNAVVISSQELLLAALHSYMGALRRPPNHDCQVTSCCLAERPRLSSHQRCCLSMKGVVVWVDLYGLRHLRYGGNGIRACCNGSARIASTDFPTLSTVEQTKTNVVSWYFVFD